MTNQQLTDYIKRQEEKGKSKEEIKNNLLQVGWKEEDIDKALGISNYNQAPPPPPSSETFTSSGLKQLNPKAVWTFFVSAIVSTLVGLLILLAWVGSDLIMAGANFLPLLLVLLVLFLLFCYIWAKLSYKYYRYELAEEDFRKEYGIVFKKYTTIPYERIQNINIQRGILDRILGLSSLKIFTAGTGGSGAAGAEGLLPGISESDAEELRNELINRSRKRKRRDL